MSGSVPQPGLKGDHTGTCVMCLRPTDTGCATDGIAEWAAAFLVNLGLDVEIATTMVSLAAGGEGGTVPDGRFKAIFRLCTDCASKAGLQVGLVARDQAIPTYRQP